MSKAQPAQERLDAFVALYDQGRLSELVRLAAAAVEEFPDAAGLHNMLGTAKAGLRDLDGAIACFGRAVELKPDFAEAHNNLGLAQQQRGRVAAAIASFETALRIRPDFAEVHNNLGVALKVQDHLEDALASFRKAVQIRPGFVEAQSNLCGVLERQNKLDDMENALQSAILNCGKDNPHILFRLAQLANRRNQFEDAHGYLQKAQVDKLKPSQRMNYFNLLGKVCDKLGWFDDAYSAFVKQNELERASLETKKLDSDGLMNWILSNKAAWAAAASPAWINSLEAVIPKSPVFLVGFPRSGTTLLDTILRSHAQIAVIEEKPTVDVLLTVMNRTLGHRPTIEDLARLSEPDIRSLREIYFKELKRHLDRADDSKLIVDKSPFNIMHADVIHRMFPDAKFIFALRHPCDSVLSCFMQIFKLHDATANFVSLDRSARFYAAFMDLWSKYQQKLNLDVHVLKYEDLIQDFAGTCKLLMGFLGLEWDNNVFNYQKTALDRDRIGTPSYSQVTQPLYRQASGRWMKYGKQMQPVLPVLQPWVEAFGYGTAGFTRPLQHEHGNGQSTA